LKEKLQSAAAQSHRSETGLHIFVKFHPIGCNGRTLRAWTCLGCCAPNEPIRQRKPQVIDRARPINHRISHAPDNVSIRPGGWGRMGGVRQLPTTPLAILRLSSSPVNVPKGEHCGICEAPSAEWPLGAKKREAGIYRVSANEVGAGSLPEAWPRKFDGRDYGQTGEKIQTGNAVWYFGEHDD
jgi:hypothetical protein